MADRTTKLLLALIVLGLWGLLFRPVFTPVPAQAQDVSRIQLTAPVLAIHPTTGVLYLAAPDGNVYLFDPNTLELRARAINTFPFESRQNAETRARSYVNPSLRSP